VSSLFNCKALSAGALAFAFVSLYAPTAFAQEANTPAQNQGSGRWQGQREGRGEFGMMGGGRGTVGTVTAVAPDHYKIKTETGEIYTIHFSVNTRIMNQAPPRQREAEGRQGDLERGGERTPPQPIKPDEIKVGDIIAAGGEEDEAAKSIGAVFVMLVDPERARQMRAMEANYGKTWLMGKVTGIDGVKVTIEGIRDKKPYTFTADENTTFRKRREPITLADVQEGDMVRVEGGPKDGGFLATAVAVMVRPSQEGIRMEPRGNPPQ
jgi:hypothetical protein